MNRCYRAILAPLLAVGALWLGLAENASAGFNPAAQNPHYGQNLLWESEASASAWLQPADPTKGNGEWIYDSPSGVPAYVRQNPWSYFDPLGLRSDSAFSDPGQSREDRDAVRKVMSSPPSPQLMSTASDAIPFVGTGKGVYETFSGVDPITKNKVNRWVTGGTTLLSVVPFGKNIGKALLKPFFKSGGDEVIEAGIKNLDDVGKSSYGLRSTTARDIAERLPDEAMVVRGGVATPAQIEKGIGPHRDVPGLSGFSAQSRAGTTVEELASKGGVGGGPLPHGQVSVSSAGQLRGVGADVVPSPGAGANHVTVTPGAATPTQLSEQFIPRPNPAKLSNNP